MLLSDLLGLAVRDAGGTAVGTVTDVRLCVPGDPGKRPGAPELFGIVVSPHTTSAYLGYERSDVHRPRLVAVPLRWRHRGSLLALWRDVARVGAAELTLRAGTARYSPVLRRQ